MTSIKPIYLFSALLTLLLALSITMLIYTPTTSEKTNQLKAEPAIITSTYLLSYLYNAMTAELNLTAAKPLLKAGMDAHSFTPTAHQMQAVEQAPLIFVLNTPMDNWLLEHPQSVDVSKAITRLEDEHTQMKDPHFWMAISNVKKIIIAMEQALRQHYLQHADTIHTHASTLLQQCELLEQKNKERFASCRVPGIIMTHNALAYVANAYHFRVMSLEGAHPDAQASAKTFLTLQQYVKTHQITTLFYESQEPSQALQALHAHATLQPIYLFTSDEPIYHKSDLFDVMETNYDALAKAMQCN